jgi:hypothetical protein
MSGLITSLWLGQCFKRIGKAKDMTRFLLYVLWQDMVCLTAGTSIPSHSLVLYGGWQAACRLDCYKVQTSEAWRA